MKMIHKSCVLTLVCLSGIASAASDYHSNFLKLDKKLASSDTANGKCHLCKLHKLGRADEAAHDTYINKYATNVTSPDFDPERFYAVKRCPNLVRMSEEKAKAEQQLINEAKNAFEAKGKYFDELVSPCNPIPPLPIDDPRDQRIQELKQKLHKLKFQSDYIKKLDLQGRFAQQKMQMEEHYERKLAYKTKIIQDLTNQLIKAQQNSNSVVKEMLKKIQTDCISTLVENVDDCVAKMNKKKRMFSKKKSYEEVRSQKYLDLVKALEEIFPGKGKSLFDQVNK